MRVSGQTQSVFIPTLFVGLEDGEKLLRLMRDPQRLTEQVVLKADIEIADLNS